MKIRTRHGLTTAAIAALAIGVMTQGSLAGKGTPSFNPEVWGDGQAWGTKGTTAIPAPNDHNGHSYDGLFVIINSNNPAGQLPVAEAAPGNINYNGGRWIVYTALWTQAGFDEHGTVPVLTSYAEFLVHYMLGHLDFELGPPEDGPPPYFECPLLPVKD